ncbi:MAG: glycosyltransferase family 2 protein [Bacteroidia bacterium]|nr:glycosyltransferase family 2 protein [Bacteroidia bacterium]
MASRPQSAALVNTLNSSGMGETRPLVSVITPAYNESAIITKNLSKLCEYMESLADKYRYEIVVVNDGSKDGTAELADNFAKEHHQVIVHHHNVNKNLGGALKTGFEISNGDYVIVMDLDLSYSPDHIERLLAKMEETEADMVIASPYMKGGKNSDVPAFRLLLSKVVNYFMKLVAPQKISTFTSMVRAYRKSFLKKLNLKSNTYSINPEIIHKGLILRARIEEIPAHLDWGFQKELGPARTSSIRVLKGILAGLMTGFIFRPYAFFMIVGLVLLLLAGYMIGWLFVHTIAIYPEIVVAPGSFDDQFTEAVKAVFYEKPHAFVVGGITLLAALQFLGIGFLSLQSKRYFDEMFHISTTIFNQQQKD